MAKAGPQIPDALMDRVDDLVPYVGQHAPYGTGTRRNTLLHALSLGLDQMEAAKREGLPPPAARQPLPPAPVPSTSIPAPQQAPYQDPE